MRSSGQNAAVMAATRYAAAGILLLAAAGCVSVPGAQTSEQPQARTISVTLGASSDVNPGPDGRAAPLPVQVYVLRSTGAFQSQDYFGLKGGSAISADQVDSRSISLRPGETKQLSVNSGTDGAYLGVIAGYRNIDNANWRAVSSLGTSDSFVVRAGKSSISISAR